MHTETTTSLLGLQAWFVEDCDIHSEHEIRIRLQRRLPFHVCSRCGERTTKVYDHEIRTLRDLPICGKAVYLYVPQVRVICSTCKAVITERLDLCDPRQMLTRRYELFIAHLCQFADLSAVAELEGLSWATVCRIDRKYLLLRQQAYKIGDVTRICIDEVAYRKGQRYLTIVSDFDTRDVIWVGIGREKATVAAFFAALGAEKTAGLQCVAMDMCAAYIAAVEEGARGAGSR